MYRLAGFTDEAADDIQNQIRATRALGWDRMELRSVDGTSVHDITDEAFDHVRRSLDDAGIEVCCLGSTIANWSKRVDEDRQSALAQARRCADRMRMLGTNLVRIMSYAILRDREGRALPGQRVEERISRLRELCAVFLDAGMTPVHENCLTWGGMSPLHTKELLDAVPGLRIVYDTGNPGITPDFRTPFPYANQNAWEAYQAVKDQIAHVHIKDGWRDPATGEERYFYPGEGPNEVRRVLADLLQGGYRGTFSIEPHMAIVYHDAARSSSAEARFGTYVEYGKRVEALLAEVDSPRD